MNRTNYCVYLAKHISEVTESEITEIQVSSQLMLIELGREPSDKLIGRYIRETSSELNKLI